MKNMQIQLTFAALLTKWYVNQCILLIIDEIIQIIVHYYGDYNTNFDSNIIPLPHHKYLLMEMLCGQLDNKSVALNRIFSAKNN